MQAHGVHRILTLNAGDFQRYGFLEILTPESLISS
jgi:hypothetical protein